MPGIRIQHPRARNARYVVVESANPYPVPYQCTAPEMGGCGGVHLFKTHHINLDETGAGIVSPVVFERIRGRLILDGFSVGQEVAKPPAIGVGLGVGPGRWGNIPILRSESGRDPA